MTLRIRVAYAAPGCEALVDVEVPEGACVLDAVAASGVVARLGLDAAALSHAIFGQRADPATPLRDGDRVELLRPLVIEPQAARRLRAATHPPSRVRGRNDQGPGGGG